MPVSFFIYSSVFEIVVHKRRVFKNATASSAAELRMLVV
jgi:hypothetical protein